MRGWGRERRGGEDVFAALFRCRHERRGCEPGAAGEDVVAGLFRCRHERMGS